MVRNISDGIIVEQVLGAGQGNILAGEFNANVLLGYRISGGKIIGRVKDCVISGNVYNVLNSIEAIGSESRWIGGSLKTPAIYCHGVSVASKNQ
jgi:PmbA protein